MAKKKQPKKDKIVLTIRATEAPEIALLNELKEKTGSKTYTGAVYEAARAYPHQIRRIEELSKQVKGLEKIKREQNELLHFMHSGQKQLEAYGKKFLKDAGKYPEPEMEFEDDDDDDF